MYERLKEVLLAYRRQHNKASGSLLEKGTVTAISAGTAGSIAAVITTPIDVVKTRIMLSAASDPDSSSIKSDALKQVAAQGKDPQAELERARKAARGGRAGGVAVGREIWRTEGVRGLFRGGALRAAWTAGGSGLYLGVYECGRSWLEESRVRGEGEGEAVG